MPIQVAAKWQQGSGIIEVWRMKFGLFSNGFRPHSTHAQTYQEDLAEILTKQIRLGAAVKIIHLHHPVDVAIQAAVTDHVIGDGRFIFGFGSGFAAPHFSTERGLSFEDRHSRLMESLELILDRR
jgi:alkanesulfonate monooxygenase SsuD/methylene tetrahydromethanopterin reductase-like flavin-dependent oxidoreductase (luciferase family)